MILIAHRGNIGGPNPEKENHPDYIEDTIKKGYEIEVDVWYVEDGCYLGHDGPQYKVDISFFENKPLWCHSKNIEAVRYLLDNQIHCFFHKTDDVTLTSRGYIWTFPNKPLVPRSVCVMPERGYNGELSNCIGICSDYIQDYRL